MDFTKIWLCLMSYQTSRSFNAEVILTKGQWWNYLTHSWWWGLGSSYLFRNWTRWFDCSSNSFTTMSQSTTLANGPRRLTTFRQVFIVLKNVRILWNTFSEIFFRDIIRISSVASFVFFHLFKYFFQLWNQNIMQESKTRQGRLCLKTNQPTVYTGWNTKTGITTWFI